MDGGLAGSGFAAAAFHRTIYQPSRQGDTLLPPATCSQAPTQPSLQHGDLWMALSSRSLRGGAEMKCGRGQRRSPEPLSDSSLPPTLLNQSASWTDPRAAGLLFPRNEKKRCREISQAGRKKWLAGPRWGGAEAGSHGCWLGGLIILQQVTPNSLRLIMVAQGPVPRSPPPPPVTLNHREFSLLLANGLASAAKDPPASRGGATS